MSDLTHTGVPPTARPPQCEPKISAAKEDPGGPRELSRLRMLYVCEGITIIATAGEYLRGPHHAIVMFCALTLYTLGRTTWHRSKAKAWILVGVALVVGITAYPKSKPTPARAPAPHQARFWPLPPIGVIVGPRRQVAEGLRAVSASVNGLIGLTDLGAASFDPTETDAVAPLPISGPNWFDLAGDANDIVAVRNGWASIYDSKTLKPSRPPVHFGEDDGHVTVGFRSAWLCSTNASKVDRLNLITGNYSAVPVPSEPTAIAAGGGFVWAALADNLVARIDPSEEDQTTTFRTSVDPTLLTFAFGKLWIYHAQTGTITQMSRNGRVTLTIVIGTDIVSMIGFKDSVYAVSQAAGELLRIDPSTGVVSRTRVPLASGLAIYDKRLWVTSAAGFAAEVNAVPLAVLRAVPNQPPRGGTLRAAP